MFVEKRIENGFRCALAIFSGKIIFNFGVQKRLRAFLNPIFTGGVVVENCLISRCAPFREKVSRENPQIFPTYI